MCFFFKSKPKPPEASNNQTRGGPAHIGGPGLGVWPVRPLPPEPSYQGDCGQNLVREKKFNDTGKKSPPSPPPKYNWDSDNGKGRNPKKSSACDQKFTSEPTAKVNQSPTLNSDSDSPVTRKSSACDQKFTSEATAKVNQSPMSNSDSDSPLTGKTSEFKQPLPSTPEKYMMNSWEEERNMTEYPASAYEEQYTKTRKTPSDEKKDRKPEGTNHVVYPNQQTVDSDSETGQRTRGRNFNEEE